MKSGAGFDAAIQDALNFPRTCAGYRKRFLEQAGQRITCSAQRLQPQCSGNLTSYITVRVAYELGLQATQLHKMTVWKMNSAVWITTLKIHREEQRWSVSVGETARACYVQRRFQPMHIHVSSCKPSVPFHPPRSPPLSLCLSPSPFLVQCNFKLIMHRTTPAVGSRRVIFRQFTPSWPKEAANKPASISRHAIPRTRYLWYPELGLPSAYTCITHACGAHGSLEHRGDSPLCRHRGRISILTHFAESTPIDWQANVPCRSLIRDMNYPVSK